jgi:hypothetical protein
MTTRDPALAALTLFLGEWSMVARFPRLPVADVDARVSFRTWEHDFDLSYAKLS